MAEQIETAVVVVSVPPKAEFLHLLRSVTGGVALGMRLPVDSVDDLRLAVDEASIYLLLRSPTAEALSLSLLRTDSSLQVTVSTTGNLIDWPPADFKGSLPGKVISGLVDDVTAELSRDGAPSIVMEKRTLDASRE